MLVIETDQHRNPDRDSLIQFLEACRDAAEEDDHYKLASISLRVRHIDPLAVLESIYEADQAHIYIEHPQLDLAIAGAEAVLEHRCEGRDRFLEARQFSEEVLEHTIAVGDLGIRGAGPQFFCAFTFYDEQEPGEAFPPGLVFVPCWQVARYGGDFVAVANCRVDADSDTGSLADRIWSAHQKFSSFHYDAVDSSSAPSLVSSSEVAKNGSTSYPDAVTQALERIRAGAYEKIVLARAVDLTFDGGFRPLPTLNRLRARFPSCYAFSTQAGAHESFIGATPERLVRRTGNTIETEAIAGSAPRGDSAMEDAKQARSLLSSEKDLREHRHVIDSIRRRLAALGIESTVNEFPELIRLANVQHLRSPIRATASSETHLLDVVAALHPTPAVGGAPREAAVPEIAGLEPITRSLYAGTLGWFGHTGEGEFVVALRCARIRDEQVRLYAGAGIVEGSVPEREEEETRFKMSALLDAIRS